MKVGDLVRVPGEPDEVGGIIISICEEVVTTIDVLLHDGNIAYDQRTDSYMVINESR
jgi:hypothetical protein